MSILTSISPVEAIDIITAYSEFTGFSPSSMLVLLSSCNRYGFSFEEILEDSKFRYKNFDLETVFSNLKALAIKKLITEYSFYSSDDPADLPDPNEVFSNNKTSCSKKVFNKMSELFKFKEDFLNIIHDLIEVH